MKTITRAIVSFYELSEEWQIEARSNLDEFAEEASYLEPKDGQTPEKHILWSLNECMVSEGKYEGFKFNTTIVISNNSAMLLNINDTFEEAEYIII